MTVVIHEFEVVPEPSQGEQKSAEKPQEETATATAALTPQEVERIVHREIKRLKRVCAY
jgi:hypothetical protein